MRSLWPVVAICSLFLALSACRNAREETYDRDVAQTWSRLSSSGQAASGYALLGPIAAMNVRVVFQTLPDRTASWSFARDGKEIARVEATVTGNKQESTISYRYSAGGAARQFPKVEDAISAFSYDLLVGGIHAGIERRPLDLALKDQAEAQAMMIVAQDIFKEAANHLRISDEDLAKWKERDEIAERRIARSRQEMAEAQRDPALAIKPATDLSGY